MNGQIACCWCSTVRLLKTTKPRCSRLSSVFTARPANASAGGFFSLSVSPWIIGYPHRIRALERVLNRILDVGSVWHATGMDIVAAFKSQVSRT